VTTGSRGDERLVALEPALRCLGLTQTTTHPESASLRRTLAECPQRAPYPRAAPTRFGRRPSWDASRRLVTVGTAPRRRRAHCTGCICGLGPSANGLRSTTALRAVPSAPRPRSSYVAAEELGLRGVDVRPGNAIAQMSASRSNRWDSPRSPPRSSQHTSCNNFIHHERLPRSL